MALSFEGRIQLRSAIAAVQREREHRARRLHMVTLYGEKMYLGGDERPGWKGRIGYPSVVDSRRHG